MGDNTAFVPPFARMRAIVANARKQLDLEAQLKQDGVIPEKTDAPTPVAPSEEEDPQP